MIIEDYMGFNHERYGIIVDIVDEYWWMMFVWWLLFRGWYCPTNILEIIFHKPIEGSSTKYQPGSNGMWQGFWTLPRCIKKLHFDWMIIEGLKHWVKLMFFFVCTVVLCFSRHREKSYEPRIAKELWYWGFHEIRRGHRWIHTFKVLRHLRSFSISFLRLGNGDFYGTRGINNL